MVRIFSTQITHFPSVSEADDTGLIAIGGSYNYQTLYNAYISGIFPWFDEKIVFGNKYYNYIYWYSPDPRFVLFKKDFRIGSRLDRYFKKSNYRYSFNEAFELVIKSCQNFGFGSAGLGFCTVKYILLATPSAPAPFSAR